MHNPQHILENEMRKLLWDFQIQSDHLILGRQPDLEVVKKKKKKKRKPAEWMTERKQKER